MRLYAIHYVFKMKKSCLTYINNMTHKNKIKDKSFKTINKHHMNGISPAASSSIQVASLIYFYQVLQFTRLKKHMF